MCSPNCERLAHQITANLIWILWFGPAFASSSGMRELSLCLCVSHVLSVRKRLCCLLSYKASVQGKWRTTEKLTNFLHPLLTPAQEQAGDLCPACPAPAHIHRLWSMRVRGSSFSQHPLGTILHVPISSVKLGRILPSTTVWWYMPRISELGSWG